MRRSRPLSNRNNSESASLWESVDTPKDRGCFNVIDAKPKRTKLTIPRMNPLKYSKNEKSLMRLNHGYPFDKMDDDRSDENAYTPKGCLTSALSLSKISGKSHVNENGSGTENGKWSNSGKKGISGSRSNNKSKDSTIRRRKKKPLQDITNGSGTLDQVYSPDPDSSDAAVNNSDVSYSCYTSTGNSKDTTPVIGKSNTTWDHSCPSTSQKRLNDVCSGNERQKSSSKTFYEKKIEWDQSVLDHSSDIEEVVNEKENRNDSSSVRACMNKTESSFAGNSVGYLNAESPFQQVAHMNRFPDSNNNFLQFDSNDCHANNLRLDKLSPASKFTPSIQKFSYGSSGVVIRTPKEDILYNQDQAKVGFEPVSFTSLATKSPQSDSDSSSGFIAFTDERIKGSNILTPYQNTSFTTMSQRVEGSNDIFVHSGSDCSSIKMTSMDSTSSSGQITECVADIFDQSIEHHDCNSPKISHTIIKQVKIPTSILRNGSSRIKKTNYSAIINTTLNTTHEIAECVGDAFEESMASDRHSNRSKSLSRDDTTATSVEIAQCVADIMDQSMAPNNHVHYNNRSKSLSRDDTTATSVEIAQCVADIMDQSMAPTYSSYKVGSNSEKLSKKTNRGTNAEEKIEDNEENEENCYLKVHPISAGSSTSVMQSIDEQSFRSNSTSVDTQTKSGSTQMSAVLSNDHLDVSANLVKVGIEFLNKEQYMNSVNTFEEALQVRKKVFGRDHPLVAKVYNNLGVAFIHLEFYKEALVSFQKALISQNNSLKRLIKSYNPGNNEVIATYNLEIADMLCNIGSVCLDWINIWSPSKQLNGKMYLAEKADHAFSRALEIQVAIIVPETEHVEETRKICNEAKMLHQSFRQQHELLQKPAALNLTSPTKSHEIRIDTSTQSFPSDEITLTSSSDKKHKYSFGHKEDKLKSGKQGKLRETMNETLTRYTVLDHQCVDISSVIPISSDQSNHRNFGFGIEEQCVDLSSLNHVSSSDGSNSSTVYPSKSQQPFGDLSSVNVTFSDAKPQVKLSSNLDRGKTTRRILGDINDNVHMRTADPDPNASIVTTSTASVDSNTELKQKLDDWPSVIRSSIEDTNEVASCVQYQDRDLLPSNVEAEILHLHVVQVDENNGKGDSPISSSKVDLGSTEATSNLKTAFQQNLVGVRDMNLLQVTENISPKIQTQKYLDGAKENMQTRETEDAFEYQQSTSMVIPANFRDYITSPDAFLSGSESEEKEITSNNDTSDHIFKLTKSQIDKVDCTTYSGGEKISSTQTSLSNSKYGPIALKDAKSTTTNKNFKYNNASNEELENSEEGIALVDITVVGNIETEIDEDVMRSNPEKYGYEIHDAAVESLKIRLFSVFFIFCSYK